MESEGKIERCVCSYKNLSDRFILKERKFDLQYSQLYAVRLMAMKKKLAVAVRKKWGKLRVVNLYVLEYSSRKKVFNDQQKMKLKLANRFVRQRIVIIHKISLQIVFSHFLSDYLWICCPPPLYINRCQKMLVFPKIFHTWYIWRLLSPQSLISYHFFYLFDIFFICYYLKEVLFSINLFIWYCVLIFFKYLPNNAIFFNFQVSLSAFRSYQT